MSKTYILYLKVLKGEEAKGYHEDWAFNYIFRRHYRSKGEIIDGIIIYEVL